MNNKRHSDKLEGKSGSANNNKKSSKLSDLINSGYFKDILSKRYHSQDFKETRADYIAGRLKLMSLAFAILVPASALIDLVLLPVEVFNSILVARFSLGVSLIAVALIAHFKKSSAVIEWLLPLSFLLPSLFYLFSMLILKDAAVQVNIGFSFIPFLCAAMMGLYPMTIVTCLIVTSTIFVPTLALEIIQGTLFTIGALNLFWAFFMFVGVSWWVQTGQLLMLMKLYRESTQDPLTGLINRRVLMKFLEAEKESCDGNETVASEQTRNFCVLMCDLDRFKRINDTYGHLSGDMVLKAAAKVLKSELRSDDIVARFGGEEFVAVLPNLSIADAVIVAERVREACSNLNIAVESGDVLTVTTSIGVAQYQHGESLPAMLERVDELLYVAKKEGRNKVIS